MEDLASVVFIDPKRVGHGQKRVDRRRRIVEVDRAAEILARIDDYYADQHEEGDGVVSQLVRQLSDPRPVDRSVIDQLPSYRRLRRRWSDWGAVTEMLGAVGARMVSP